MAQKKDKEKYGREFAPDCEFQVYELNDNWGASVAIGDYYYETDPYANKQDAIDEQRGCLLAIKEQIEKYLEKLGKNSQEPVSEDLKEEIVMWMKEHFDRDMSRYSGCYLTTNSLLKYARHFANWQKNKMMEDAVDGVVAASAGGDGWVNIATGFVKSEDVNVKFGDKIKIIVVKED